jgi:pimeloyl-ACP methyl ester carboxylesterase
VLGDLLKVEQNRIQKSILGGMGDAFTDAKWEIPKQFAKAFDGKLQKYPIAKGAVEYAKSINADLKCLAQLQKFQPTTSLLEWQNIETPILLLNGDQDTYNGDKEKLNNIIPNSKLIIIPGDHNTSYRSNQFSKEVIKYFSNE